jgi:hypothetical protein
VSLYYRNLSWVLGFIVLGVGLRLKGYVLYRVLILVCVRYFRGFWTCFAGICGFSSVKFVFLGVGVCCGILFGFGCLIGWLVQASS